MLHALRLRTCCSFDATVEAADESKEEDEDEALRSDADEDVAMVV